MCGIIGSVSKTHIDFTSILDQLQHRGPDGSGYFCDENDLNGYVIQLGHRRLSIIDLSDNAKQPFCTTNDEYVITFNGEIYNYEELSRIYLSKNTFVSNSDTEIIIELYKQYGTKSFAWLQGMFAFAIYDKIHQKVILARDGLGIKPLYYYRNKQFAFFSSEIKALKKFPEIDISLCSDSFVEFFLNGFIYEPNTGYKNIFKVFPGSFVEIFLTETLDYCTTVYWKPSCLAPYKKSERNLLNLIKYEFKRHLVADVKIGLFYSGGIDSSVLLNLGENIISAFFLNSKKHQTKKGDLYYADLIANKLKRKYEIIDFSVIDEKPDDILLSIDHVARYSEELIADYTFIVSELLAKKTREKGFKVMLSGMGGDEIFLGYPRYKLVYYSRFFKIFNQIFDKWLLKKNKSFSKKRDRFNGFFENKEFVLQYSNLVGYFNEKELGEILINYQTVQLSNYIAKLRKFIAPYQKLTKVRIAQILDLYGFLSHNFMVADKSSMLAGVEIRIPLVTPTIFDYVFSMKLNVFLSLFVQKRPLLKMLKKQLSLKYFKRPKEGFNPDLENIVNKIGIDKLRNTLNDHKFCEIVSRTYVNKILIEHFNGEKNNSYKIYQLVYFRYWINCNS